MFCLGGIFCQFEVGGHTTLQQPISNICLIARRICRKWEAPRSLSSAQCLVLWSFWHISTQKRYANHAPVEGRPWKKWLGDFKAKPPSNVFVTFERHPMRKRPKILKHFVFGIGKGIRKVVPHQNFPFPVKLLQPKSSGSRWAQTGKAQLRMDVPKFGQLEPLPQSRELAS